MKVKWSEAKYIAEDPNDTGLRFTDILFGFALREVVIRLAKWDHLSNAARVHLLLGAVTILGSYIGYRNSQKRGKFKLRFFNLATIRFGLDQVMVFLYFWLGIYISIDKDPITGKLTLPGPQALLKFDVWVVFAIFGLYLLWDLVSHWMVHSGRYFFGPTPQDTATVALSAEVYRTLITLGGLVLSGSVLLVYLLADPHGDAAVWCIGGLIGMTIVYRMAKDVIQKS